VDEPYACFNLSQYRGKRDNQATFAQSSDGPRSASQDIPVPYLFSNDVANGRDWAEAGAPPERDDDPIPAVCTCLLASLKLPLVHMNGSAA